MFNIIPSLLIILGIAGLVYIFQYRQNKESIIKGEEELAKIKKEKKKLLEKLQTKLSYKKVGSGIYSLTEKVLVRSRIIVLRIDKTISANLTKIRIRRKTPNFKGSEDIIKSFAEKTSLENNAEIDTKLDSLQEEKKLLKKISKSPENLAAFKNLARIYLWREDFSSARWALLQAYHLNKEDNVVQDLLIELYEKRGGAR
ncbi:MAG: hypothetical protein PHG13_01005 [Candidatus Pacebacteria bacterium]|nr:hypothetical protein [Candidatus Paceibacterota bacterium]MDD5721967.1 hypothetical protein [Candidatus Paceibacterota bacterium]